MLTDIRKWACLLLVAPFGLLACGSRDAEQKTRVQPGWYAEARVSADEERGEVTALLQFRDNPLGLPQRLLPPAQVRLDGATLPADSARYAGVFYEARWPLSATDSSHRLSFDDGAQTGETIFYLQPLVLQLEADSFSRSNFRLQLQGVGPNSRLLVSLTDTAFMNADFQEVVVPHRGEVVLPPALLQGVKNGPVHLQLVREEVWPLRAPLKGKLVTSFSLQRDLWLTD